MEPYLIWLIIIAILAALFFLFRLLKSRKESTSQNRHISSTLQAALEQKTAFDLKLLGAEQHAAISARLVDIRPGKLTLKANEPIRDMWLNQKTEAYFRVGLEDSAVFYVFESRVLAIDNDENAQTLTLAYPDHLRVEKKRHFLRAQPDQKDILMLGVWPMTPGQRLPRSNNDIGNPPVSWKSGHSQKNVKVENISGSGIAVSFALKPGREDPGFNSELGRQILCLLVCRPGGKAPNPLIFWSASEIKNIRKSTERLTLGLEFTNTAIQQQGSPEIHWTHASPWRGVKPILQWVQHIDKSQN